MSLLQTPKGKMEAAFIASSTLKRNRRYLDIEKINEAERDSFNQRRKPHSSSKSIERKIKRSFSNSTAMLTDRIEKDILEFKTKHSSRPQSAGERATPHHTPENKRYTLNNPRIKGV
jgi:hypothetical protein